LLLHETFQTPSQAWYHEYAPINPQNIPTSKHAYAWRKVELVEDPKYGTIQYIDYRGKLERAAVYGDSVRTVLDAATYLNALRADSVQKDIDRTQQYIAWQKDRVANWRLQPVEPNAPEST